MSPSRKGEMTGTALVELLIAVVIVGVVLTIFFMVFKMFQGPDGKDVSISYFDSLVENVQFVIDSDASERPVFATRTFVALGPKAYIVGFDSDWPISTKLNTHIEKQKQCRKNMNKPEDACFCLAIMKTGGALLRGKAGGQWPPTFSEKDEFLKCEPLQSKIGENDEYKKIVIVSTDRKSFKGTNPKPLVGETRPDQASIPYAGILKTQDNEGAYAYFVLVPNLVNVNIYATTAIYIEKYEEKDTIYIYITTIADKENLDTRFDLLSKSLNKCSLLQSAQECNNQLLDAQSPGSTTGYDVTYANPWYDKDTGKPGTKCTGGFFCKEDIPGKDFGCHTTCMPFCVAEGKQGEIITKDCTCDKLRYGSIGGYCYCSAPLAGNKCMDSAGQPAFVYHDTYFSVDLSNRYANDGIFHYDYDSSTFSCDTYNILDGDDTVNNDDELAACEADPLCHEVDPDGTGRYCTSEIEQYITETDMPSNPLWGGNRYFHYTLPQYEDCSFNTVDSDKTMLSTEEEDLCKYAVNPTCEVQAGTCVPVGCALVNGVCTRT